MRKQHHHLKAFLMMALGFLITFWGGIKPGHCWSDLIQFLIYTAAAVRRALHLRSRQFPA